MFTSFIFVLNVIPEVYIMNMKIQKQTHWTEPELERNSQGDDFKIHWENAKRLSKWRGKKTVCSPGRQTSVCNGRKYETMCCHFNRKNWKSALFLLTSFLLLRAQFQRSCTKKFWFAYIHLLKLLFAFILCLVYQLYQRRRQCHPTPVLLPGKSHGRRSLVGCSPWGR